MKNVIIKRIIGVICLISMLFSAVAPVAAAGISGILSGGSLIEASDIPLRLHYDKEAPYGNEGASSATGITEQDGWERWSLPIGNGYFGANVFGRTETERIQITEKTLSNPYSQISPEGQKVSLGGLNNFSETYVDIGHKFSDVTDYSRWLDLKTAISGVSYSYEGVKYTREYFTSYPDKALVIRLDASEEGALSFVLRPTVPWKQEYASWEGDGASKTGQVISYVDGGDGIVELSGKMGYYDVDFLGIYRVVTNGGEVSATTCTNEYGEIDGTITVSGATGAYIYVTLGSDYELTSEVFTTSDTEKPTFDTTLEDARVKVEGEAKAIADQLAGKSFEDGYTILKNNHLSDYTELFGRVTLDLGDSEDAYLTTDELLNKYKNGEYSRYLETLYFQYGRYLLIECSRSGALPLNLQGTWNRYNKAPWGSGIWHNINEQMSYWHAFSTNLAETFDAYVEYNAAYMPAAEKYTTDIVKKYNPSQLDMDGGNGWSIGTGSFPYYISGDRSSGNLGFTTQLYWEYYQYTQDKTLLEQVVFPILVSAARYVVKSVELDEEGHYLVSNCDSPEMHVNGVWLRTKGTTYAQSFSYLNNYNALLAAKELGIDLSDSAVIDTEELCVFKRVMEQLDKYDPIIVGLSGQIKEFRQEDYYCSMGDDPHHRHISQLVGLYPGDIINSNTPAWLDAAKVTLTERGDRATGWGIAHRLNLWARTKDGDRTYLLLNRLLYSSTATNLWDLCPPFVIDGNFGGTAGISEMLLQSHEGYIAPLAAIPAAWDSGSYTGLVARGNFEVAAEWKNGIATCFNITSKAGGDASVSYGGITSAKVIRTSDGKAVDYTVSGTDVITFKTEVGETYVISGFKLTEKLPAPASLNVSRVGLGESTLTWEEVEGAVGYKVYTAIESQPDYTLLGVTAENGAVYIPESENINARTTFKVVPINSDGVEGHGAVAYQNPIEINATVSDYEAYAFENGELQVTVKASDNTQSYKFWKKAEGESEYTLLTESPYPIIVYDGYLEADSYALSVVSKYQRTESELYELEHIKASSAAVKDDSPVWYTNIFVGKPFVPDAGATPEHSSAYSYSKITDGNIGESGRFGTKATGSEDAIADGVIELGGTHLLSEMRIYDFPYNARNSTRVGDSITVYAFYDEKWTEVKNISSRAEIVAAKQLDTSISQYYIPIDLSGVKCTAIRIRMVDNSGQGPSVYEITCSGAYFPSESVSNENVLLGKAPSFFSSTVETYSSDFTVANITDGTSTRQGLKDGKNNSLTLEYDLGVPTKLGILKIYDFVMGIESVSRVSSAVVEAYVNGNWIRCYSNPLLAPSERLSDAFGKYTPIDFEGITATKIRLILTNTLSERGISIHEIVLNSIGLSDAPPEEENILSDKLFTGDKAPYSHGTLGTFGYDKLTDGSHNGTTGRFAIPDSNVADTEVTLECELEDVYRLNELRIYDFYDGGITRITALKLEVYYSGEWYTLIDGEPLLSGSDRAKDDKGYYTPLLLDGVKAEKIRLHCYNGTGNYKGITFYEITCSGTKTSELADKNVLAGSASVTLNKTGYTSLTNSSNVLLGTTFVANPDMTAVFSNSYGVSKLTDGIYNKNPDGSTNIQLSRYSSKQEANACFDGTVTFDGTYLLGELRIYDFDTGASTYKLGDRIAVYALIDGDWRLVASYASGEEVKAARVKDDAFGLYYLQVDMSGIKATAIRVCTKNTLNTVPISIYEITCSGAKLSDTAVSASSSTLTETQISSITDKDSSTSFNAGVDALSYSLEFDLGQVYRIYVLNVRDVRAINDLVGGNAATRSNDTYVDLYMDGKWVRVVSGASLSVAEEFTSFNLYGLSASKIRIGFNNTQTFDNGASPVAMISEISVSVGGAAADKKPLLNAYAALPVIADGDENYTANMKKFSGYMTEFMLSDADVAKYASEMIAYNATLLNGSHAAHNIVKHEAKAPTCTEKGFFAYEKCTLCDYTTYESILPIGHVASDGWSTDADNHWRACTGCGERLELAEHRYADEADIACDVCGYVRELTATEGEVSRKIFWAFEDGVLSVTGRGKIKNFSANTAPWCHLADQITKVVIGEGITYIGSSAFFNFAAIEAVELPSTLTAIGRYAFYGCANLKSITIPEAVTEIGAYAFRRSGLETIDFAIGYGWSAGDKSFNITEITAGGWRFISKSYYKLDWVRNVEAEAETLPSDYVAGGIMYTDVLWTITTLESGKLKLTIFGNGIMADYGTACAPWYSYAADIVEVEVCEGVTSIGRCAFYGLKFVRTVTLPETLTAIGDYGFYMCYLLKTITIPESVTVIGKDAFTKTGVTI